MNEIYIYAVIGTVGEKEGILEISDPVTRLPKPMVGTDESVGYLRDVAQAASNQFNLPLRLVKLTESELVDSFSPEEEVDQETTEENTN